MQELRTGEDLGDDPVVLAADRQIRIKSAVSQSLVYRAGPAQLPLLTKPRAIARAHVSKHVHPKKLK